MLKARYAHVLSFSPKKHGKYALLAADKYLELIKFYEQKAKKIRKNTLVSMFNCYRIRYYNFKKYNDDQNSLSKIGSETYIFNFNAESTCLFRVRSDLFGLMMREKRYFQKMILLALENYASTFLNHWEIRIKRSLF